MRKKPTSSGAGTYDVGYGKPPVHTRFQKGRSGNPRGSSRKNRAIERANEVILEEAYRPVAIREGEKVQRIPALAAVFRSQMAIALKGNGPAQRAALKLVKEIEAGHFAIHTKYLEEAIAYKVDGRREIERRHAAGITDISDIDPHPDDILIDIAAGEVYTPELNRKDGQKLRALGLKR
jgi:hypothetical protein